MRRNPLQKLPLSTSERSWMQEAESWHIMEHSKKWMYTENAAGKVETERQWHQKDTGWGQEGKSIYWSDHLGGKEKGKIVIFSWRVPLYYEKMSTGWSSIMENSIFGKNYWTNLSFSSYLKQNNVMVEDENVTVSAFWKKWTIWGKQALSVQEYWYHHHI